MAEVGEGELVAVEPTNRGNGRLLAHIGSPDDIHAVMEAVALDTGVARPGTAAGGDRRARPARARPAGSARPSDLHGRSAHREGLRRCLDGRLSGAVAPHPGAHRRCGGLRRAGVGARPRCRGPGHLGVPARAGRPDAAVRAVRRRLQPLARRRSPCGHRHARPGRRRSRVSAHADSKRPPAHLRAGRRGARRRRVRECRADRGGAGGRGGRGRLPRCPAAGRRARPGHRRDGAPSSRRDGSPTCTPIGRRPRLTG